MDQDQNTGMPVEPTMPNEGGAVAPMAMPVEETTEEGEVAA